MVKMKRALYADMFGPTRPTWLADTISSSSRKDFTIYAGSEINVR